MRRRLADDLKSKIWGDGVSRTASPWNRLAQLAECHADASGMRPWWALKGAEITRYVFERPFGRDTAHFAQLKKMRMIYRLALGQPNQEDFLEILSRGSEAMRVLLRPLVLDLSPMGLRQATVPIP